MSLNKKLVSLFCFSCCIAVVIILTLFSINSSNPVSYLVIRSDVSTTSQNCSAVATPSTSCSSPKSITTRLTRIIHQSWKTRQLPSRFSMWANSWRQFCFPHWEYKLWTDNDNRLFIAEYYPWFLSTYDSFDWNIKRVDSARYFYLFHYGGIYADLDDECLRPFEQLLTNQSLVFGAMEGQQARTSIPEGYTQNSFMYSEPRHPFWMEVILDMMTKKDGSPGDVTGPIMLSLSIQRYRKRLPNNRDVKIYPPYFFNPFSWLENRVTFCKDLNQMTDDDIRKCREHHLNNGSYVLQYHTQTWGSGRIL